MARKIPRNRGVKPEMTPQEIQRRQRWRRKPWFRPFLLNYQGWAKTSVALVRLEGKQVIRGDDFPRPVWNRLCKQLIQHPGCIVALGRGEIMKAAILVCPDTIVIV